MIPQLEIKEKFAILAILSEIMRVDGIIHPKEEEYINNIYKVFGVTISDLEDINNMECVRAKAILDGMTDNTRNHIRSLFLEMAKCDGYVHPKEIQIINSIL